MYYSKNASQPLSVPRNYSGNTFRVIDESERHYIKDQELLEEENKEDLSIKIDETESKKDGKNSIWCVTKITIFEANRLSKHSYIRNFPLASSNLKY